MAKQRQMDRRTKDDNCQRALLNYFKEAELQQHVVNVDMHVKHCFEICRHVKNMTAGDAIDFLNQVLKIDSDRADIRRKRQQFLSD